MATLPHYSSVKAANRKEEPIYMNLFEVTFQLPSSLDGGETLTQSAKSVGLPTHPEIGTAQQSYKYSKRTYLTFPTETGFQTDVIFNVNLNENNSPYVFAKLDELYKLGYNPATGETALKQDYAFTTTVDVHNKVGEVLRRVTMKDCKLTSLSQMDLDWDSGDTLFEVTASIQCDFYDDAIVR